MISVTRDKAGTIVDGNPDKVADITDVWTFARDTTSREAQFAFRQLHDFQKRLLSLSIVARAEASRAEVDICLCLS